MSIRDVLHITMKESAYYLKMKKHMATKHHSKKHKQLEKQNIHKHYSLIFLFLIYSTKEHLLNLYHILGEIVKDEHVALYLIV